MASEILTSAKLRSILPPNTLCETVAEQIHGVQVTDPYRWLEDQRCSRTRSWLSEQGAYTQAYLDAIPDREALRVRVQSLLDVEEVSEPWCVGARQFFLKRTVGQEQASIMMKDGDSSAEIVLVDPMHRGEGNGASVNIVNISNDGNLLAYGVRLNGSDAQSVEFFNVCEHHKMRDALPEGVGPSLVFSPDGLAFYYSHEIACSSRPTCRAVYSHTLGTPSVEDRELFYAGDDLNLHVGVISSLSGKRLAYIVLRSCENTPTIDLYVHDIGTSAPPYKIVEGMDALFSPFFVGDDLFAFTGWQAPNCRIVAIDVKRPQPDNWADIVSEKQRRINEFASVGSFLCVSYVEDLSTTIEVFDLAGRLWDTIQCPPSSSASLRQRPTDSDVLFYTISGFNQRPTVFVYTPKSRESKPFIIPPVQSAPFTLERVSYRSTDGTMVPMFLIRKKDSQGPHPTLLTAYGGFGTNVTPKFNVYSSLLVELGFLFAVAQVRGGGECGIEWHEAGRRHKRQNAIDDFNAAAGWLVSEGWAQPGRLAIVGGSNAGLLVGAALTQRPELYRAAVCIGPFLDMLRYHKFDAASLFASEYGTADDEADFHYLLAYSPYHRVSDGTYYPAVLLVSGDADTRCNPLHVRKMTARLQAATTSKHPVLLEYTPSWGHTSVQPLRQRIEALTNRLAFLCHELKARV